MTPERWSDLLGTILDKFPVTKRGQAALDEGPGSMEFIEFTGPGGDIRLEFITRPVVLGKKTFGGRKIGAATGVKYEYSPDETSHQLKAWRKVGEEWQEIDSSSFTSWPREE